MLPGFRFLFAAIVLTMSILVFGLGAAALLRAAHEEFASTPVWHATPETTFAQQNEAARPVLALLRIDTPVEQKAPDSVAAEPAPAVIASTPVEPEKGAALTPQDSQPEAAKSELPVSQIAPPVEATSSAAADQPASADETKVAATATSIPTDLPAPTDETKLAAIVTPVSETAPPEPASAPVSPETSLASTKIATLGGPPVTIAPPAAASADPDKSDVKKRKHAQRAKAHRKRVRLMTVQGQLQPVDAFGQPAAPAAVRSR